MNFTTQPGTIPHRAIAWLQAQPPGSVWPTAVVADALDVDGRTLVAAMGPAVRAGVVRVECHRGHNSWSLGDGKAHSLEVPLGDTDETDDDPPVQRVVPAASAPAPAAEPAPPARPQRRPRGPDKAPRKKAQPTAGPAAAPLARSFAATEPAFPDWQLRLNELGEIAKPPRFAIWSDGALSIERAGQRLEFNTEETRSLCNYLDGVLRGGVEA